MATSQDVLNMARSLLGIAETPPGSNIVHPILDWYGEQGIQWCAATVSYVFHHVDPSLVHGLKSAYSGDFLSVGRSHGEEITSPVPGCIAIMDYGDGGITDHIGIVESVGGGKMVLIEGNHNNRVERVTRPLGGSTRFWYVLPKYSSKPKPQEDDDMALVTSGGRVSSFAGIFYVGEMGGKEWDVWAKVQNPTPAEILVRIVATTDTGNPAKDFKLGPNKILQVQVGKDMAVKGNVLVTIESPVPAVCTFDHRPRG
jgi:hypothetical protein